MFYQMDPSIKFTAEMQDGDKVKYGDVVIKVEAGKKHTFWRKTSIKLHAKNEWYCY